MSVRPELRFSSCGMAVRSAIAPSSCVSRTNTGLWLRRRGPVYSVAEDGSLKTRRWFSTQATRSDKVQEEKETDEKEEEFERVTKKWGLEAGLFKVPPTYLTLSHS